MDCNIQTLINKQPNEWLVAKGNSLKRVSSFIGKSCFVLSDFFSLGKTKQATAELIQATCNSLIKDLLNNPEQLNSNHPTYKANQAQYKTLYKTLKRLKHVFGKIPDFKNIRNLASCPELVEAEAARLSGKCAEPISMGVNGSYKLLSRTGEVLGIFKPESEEVGTSQNVKGWATSCFPGFEVGTGYRRERLAYVLDKPHHFYNVPKTKIRTLPYQIKGHPLKRSEGSFQKWVSNAQASYSQKKIPVEEVHKMAVLDIRILNSDRHLDNFLVDDKWRIHPIDHGCTFPDFPKALRFEWMLLQQAKEPFSLELLKHIEKISIKDELKRLKEKEPGISDERLKLFEISNRLLQLASGLGLTAYEIGDFMTDTKGAPDKGVIRFAYLYEECRRLSSTDMDNVLMNALIGYKIKHQSLALKRKD